MKAGAYELSPCLEKRLLHVRGCDGGIAIRDRLLVVFRLKLNANANPSLLNSNIRFATYAQERGEYAFAGIAP